MNSSNEVSTDLEESNVSMEELVDVEKFVNVIIHEEDTDSEDSDNGEAHSLNICEQDGSNSNENSPVTTEDSKDDLNSIVTQKNDDSGINNSEETHEGSKLSDNPDSNTASSVPGLIPSPGSKSVDAFYCPSCKYGTRLRGDLNRHIASVHIKQKPYHCPQCEYRTSQKCHLNTHIKSVHMKEKSYHCHLCHYKGSRKSSLNRHLLTIHKVKAESNQSSIMNLFKQMESKIFGEGERNEGFPNFPLDFESSKSLCKLIRAGLMAQAEAVQLVDGVFKCPSCVYCTRWKGDLYRHVAFMHIGDKPYHCPECNYQARQKAHLTIHIKSVHLKDKSFQCPECEYQCSRRSSLNRHIMTIHKGEKPFHCPECQYQASQSGNLKHHLLIVHRGEKPFHCSQCSFQSTKRDSLNKHIKTMHLDNDYL